MSSLRIQTWLVCQREQSPAACPRSSVGSLRIASEAADGAHRTLEVMQECAASTYLGFECSACRSARMSSGVSQAGGPFEAWEAREGA